MLTLDLPPHVDEARARLLLAIGLFQEEEVSVGKAAEIAGLSYRAFADALAERGIPLYTYTEEMWEQDLAFLQRQREQDEA
jgi:predicted HTH domain antitoxin